MSSLVTTKHTFQPWDEMPNLGVCGLCGKDTSNDLHSTDRGPLAQPQYAPYEDAIWAWTLRHGAVYNYSRNFGATVLARMHLEICGLDREKSTAAAPATDWEFGDTENGNHQIEVIAASVTCNCGIIDGQQWRLAQNKTVGEVIFEVIRAGSTESTADPRLDFEPILLPDSLLKAALNARSVSSHAEPRDAVAKFREEHLPLMWKAIAEYKADEPHSEQFYPTVEEFRQNTWNLVAQNIDLLDYLFAASKGKIRIDYRGDWRDA
jgi:hypothetical protein